MITIVYAHPYDKSFNHAVLDTLTSGFNLAGKDYQVIDLYADNFNPAFTADSLKLYSRGETADPLARKYLDMLTKTDEIIFVFPIWWGMMPAIVKGFFDKVLLVGKAYKYNAEETLVRAEINIKRTIVLTTSQGDTKYFAPFFTDYLKNRICASTGMSNYEWHNCDKTSKGPEENRLYFLNLVRNLYPHES